MVIVVVVVAVSDNRKDIRSAEWAGPEVEEEEEEHSAKRRDGSELGKEDKELERRKTD